MPSLAITCGPPGMRAKLEAICLKREHGGRDLIAGEGPSVRFSQNGSAAKGIVASATGASCWNPLPLCKNRRPTAQPIARSGSAFAFFVCLVLKNASAAMLRGDAESPQHIRREV